MEFKLKILLRFWILFTTVYEVVTSNAVGEIIPDDFDLAIGSDLKLTCVVNITFNCNKKNPLDRGFTFYYQNQTQVPSKFITTLNSSAIELRMPNAPMMNERFKCYCNKHAINYSYARVGSPPLNVTDFDCIGYNFEYLTCSFSESINPVAENYSLEYSVSYEIEDENITNLFIKQQYIYDCKELPFDRSTNKYSCNITGNGYHKVHEYYNFTLKITNALGVLNQSFNINQIEKMKPDTPNLTLVNSTDNSLTFSWTYIRAPLFKNIKGYSLLFEIKYLPDVNKKEKNDDDFILYNTTIPDTKSNTLYIIKLENLEYAYTWYDIRVRLRVKSPKVKETPWSDTYKIISQTSSRLPDTSPKTDIGSFFIDFPNHKVNLYWETLPAYKQNGKNTHYIIKNILMNGIERNLKELKMALNTAIYSYNSSNEYVFHIKSINEIGESPNYSVIKIPKLDKYKNDYQNYLPRYFNKIFHNNSYELTWDEPNSTDELQDYTVFWCKANQESHTDCENSDEGSIHFSRIDKNQRNFTKPKSNTDYRLNFGVSANYKKFSTGIDWAPCTGRLNGDFDELKLSSKAEKQTVTIYWNLACVYRILKGYNLTYCPYTENVNGLTQGIEPNCTEPEKVVIIMKNEAPGSEYVLKNLKPYKSYKINMHMFSETKSGPKSSKPVYATTMEAAPSIPRNLNIINKTSNYATIQWDIPENKNGDIRYYEIFYNENSKKLEKSKIPENSSTIVYKLEHLKSFHNYKVYVIAVTVSPSNRSNDITFKTWMGQPDSLKIRSSGLEKTGKKLIIWDPPVDAAANKTSFYKITISLRQGDERALQVVSFVEQSKCTLESVCTTFEFKAEIKGAAVNAIPKEEFDLERFEHNIFLPCGNHIQNQSSHPVDERQISSHRFREDEVFNERDFLCLEDVRYIKEKFSNKYCGMREYKFLAGNDELIYSLDCNLNKKELTHIIFVVIAVIFCGCVMFMASVFGFKKINKMKNIDFVLPPGLDNSSQSDINKSTPPKPSNERQNIEKANENLHLLSSIDNGSTGYLNCNESEKSYDANCSNDAICNNNEDGQSSTQSGNSDEINDLSNQFSNSSRSQSPNLSDRKEMNFILPLQNILNNTGNYTSGDGYVQQNILQKHPIPLTVGNGYTVLEPLNNKPTIITNPMPTSSIDNSNYVNPSSIGLVTKPKIFLTATANPNNPTLAGYVTHKQLSDYGQQKRH